VAEALDTIKIVSSPNILGGKPRIEGRRISVHHVVRHHLHGGMSLEDMQRAFDLSPAEIYAALSYYYLHQDAIESTISEERAEHEAGLLEQTQVIALLEHGIDAAEAAVRLGITERGVRKLIEGGTLPAKKIGDKWFIDPDDLKRDEVKNRRRGRPAAK
jgi:excisionase family DNA binding protein